MREQRRGAGDDRDPRRRGPDRARRRARSSARRRPRPSPSAACATSRRCWRAAATARRRSPRPSHLAERAGIRVFATGGLGGVHRGAGDTFDESADLGTLARVGICVVCAGVKSILDIPATLERLETLNVTVLGYGTDTFPAFYLTSSGLPVTWRVDSPDEVAACCARARRPARPAPSSWPTRSTSRWTRSCTTACCAKGCEAAAEQGITGRDVTPFLLERFHTQHRRRVAARERPARAAQRRARRRRSRRRDDRSSSSAT